MLLLVFYIAFSFTGYLCFEVLYLFSLVHASIIFQIRKDIPIYRKIFSTFGKFIEEMSRNFVIMPLILTIKFIINIPYRLELFLIIYEKRVILWYIIIRIVLLLLQIIMIFIFHCVPWMYNLLVYVMPFIPALIPWLGDLSVSLIPIICLDLPEISFLTSNESSPIFPGSNPSTASSPSPVPVQDSPAPSPASWEQSNPASAISTPDQQAVGFVNRQWLYSWEAFINTMWEVGMPHMPLFNPDETMATISTREPTFAFGFIKFHDHNNRPNIEGLGIAGSIFVDNSLYNPNAHQVNASLAMMATTLGISDQSWVIYKVDLNNIAHMYDIFDLQDQNMGERVNYLTYFWSYYNFIDRLDLFYRHRDVLIVDKSLLGIFIEPWRDLASIKDAAINIDLGLRSRHTLPLTWETIVNNVNDTPFSYDVNAGSSTILNDINLSVLPSIEDINGANLSLNEARTSQPVNSFSPNNHPNGSPLLDLLNANRSVWDRANNLPLSDNVTANIFISDNINGVRGELGEASSSSGIINQVEKNTHSNRVSSILEEKETFEKAFSEERENSFSRKRKFSEAFPEEGESSYKGKSRKL